MVIGNLVGWAKTNYIVLIQMDKYYYYKLKKMIKNFI